MPGVDKIKLPCDKIQDSLKGRDKKTFSVGFAQQVVYLLKHAPQTHARLRVIFQQRLADHHKQCGRHALSGHIRHDHGQMSVVHHKKIVKIAAHFLGRIHCGIDLKLFPLRKGRKQAGQHLRLNIPCHIQLRGDSLPLLTVPRLLFQKRPGALCQRDTDSRHSQQYGRSGQREEESRIHDQLLCNLPGTGGNSRIQQCLIPLSHKHTDKDGRGKQNL